MTPAQETSLLRLRDRIQEDVGRRGLRTDPECNLITACAGDFVAACRSVAETPAAAVGIVTGFYIPTAHPPCGETDGPLGAVFLARALAPLGIRVVLLTDAFCTSALEAGVALAGLRKLVPIVTLPAAAGTADQYWEAVHERTGLLTHLVALERVGPSHTPASLHGQGASPETLAHFAHLVTADHHDRCHTMRGRDVTDAMCPAHLLFEAPARRHAGVVSIGIGDGGNEIGMGKVPWDVIRQNIPGGALVACRVPTDYLIVCGISNWGAYGLAAGIRLLCGRPLDGDLLNTEREREILEAMVQRGPLVDGVSNEETATVDGLSFERYIEPLRYMNDQLASSSNGVTSAETRPNAAPQTPDREFVSFSGGSHAPDRLQAEPRHPVPAQTGADVRRLARAGELTGPTAGLAMGYVQANLVALPRDLAFDFLLFCQRNPKPCPLLDVTEAGSAEPRLLAPGADLRTDLPRYCVYRDGQLVDTPTDLHLYWHHDLVAFLLGCSFTFENALLAAGVPVRHLECGGNVPMYRTNIQCTPAGVFHGPMVVSMRPLTPAQAITATRVCGRFPRAHGVPVHFGDPAAIGIRDIHRPDFGDPVEIRPGEVPVFWACGVTPQAVVMQVKPPLVLTHQPGCMFVTDWQDCDLEG